MILLDTSAVIELLAGTEKGAAIRDHLESKAFAVSSITVNELLVCIKQKELIKGFINSVEVLPFDKETAIKSADLEASLYMKGKPTGKLDIFLAATCINHKIPIMTCDRHFSRIKDLDVILI
ncbi:type II toxin-antitoxin system VapC family toxin [Candidatus Woesearchaeota archaeon]|nr:type II toxin-antitoxin system VapC family toxin [Candidatus Woesearchaeota archaeon]